MSDVQNASAQMLTWEAGRGTTWIMEISKYVTLHRILMLKVKARAQHAFTLKQKNLF